MATVEIPMTQGHVAIIDQVDAELVYPHKWHPIVERYTVYAQTSGSRAGGRKRQQLTMHRLLTGWPIVDHINGNGLDNRRCNLRPATLSQNQHNRRKTQGSSRYKGVFWVERDQRWWSRAGYQGRSTFLGSYVHEEDAALAYDGFARQHFGEFAALNFPRPGERSALRESAPWPAAIHHHQWEETDR